MKISYLSPAAVLYLHEQLVQAFGGSPGLLDEGALASALARPRATFGGRSLYPTPFEKAAALLESLCINHAFVDGNKRVAFSAAGLFLELNGWRLKVPSGEAVTFVLSVAAGTESKETIRIWLEGHSTPYRSKRR